MIVGAALVAASCGNGNDEAVPPAEPVDESAVTAGIDEEGDSGDAAESRAPAPATTAAPERDRAERVAVLFVGHGEPPSLADGDVAISFPDGSVLGPFGDSLGVPADARTSEWAAAYDEIATAMTYIFGDVNQNDALHEMQLSPAGDVPPFFTWEAFRAELTEIYESFGDYSPHTDSIAEHVGSIDLVLEDADVGVHLAYLDTVPRIPDLMWEIRDDYDRIAVVPMLLASSTHTQEVADQVETYAPDGVEVVVVDPFYEVDFMRDRVAAAVVATAERLRADLPADVPDDKIGLLLVAHGTPYVPPDPALGWQEGEIYSHLTLIEDGFHDELADVFPYVVKTGRMNYAEPSIPASLAEFEAEGVEHVLVVPSAFPTAAMHTMWDVAEPAVGRAVTPDEGTVIHTRESGMVVYYASEGYADHEPGRQEFRDGLAYLAELGVRTALDRDADA